jgi:hypothetical protein
MIAVEGERCSFITSAQVALAQGGAQIRPCGELYRD